MNPLIMLFFKGHEILQLVFFANANNFFKALFLLFHVLDVTEKERSLLNLFFQLRDCICGGSEFILNKRLRLGSVAII